jgi:rhodanese-related sulfurtransferase
MAFSVQFLTLVCEVLPSIREVSVAQVHDRLAAGAVIVDVREREEYAAGHVTGARWLGKGVLERDIVELFPDGDVELLLYCGSGLRSALAAEAAQRMGYRNVASVRGGITALVEHGFLVG